MKCLECGKGLREGDRFCIHCGAVAEAAPAPQKPASRAGDCSGCGAALKPGDRFCQECGAPLGAAVAEQQPSRLSEPMETRYEAVESVPEEEQASAAPQQAPQQATKQSNKTFYQLLGLAFVLIACGYLAYDYLYTPKHQGLTPLTRDEVAEYEAEIGAIPPPSEPPVDTKSSGRRSPATTQAGTGVGSSSLADATPPRAATRQAPQPTQTPEPSASPPALAPGSPAGLAATAGNVSPPVRAPAGPPPARPLPSPQPVQSGPPPASPPQRQRTPGRVLMPGSQAWRRVPKSTASQPAPPAPASNIPAPSTPPRSTPTAPPRQANEGIIYWTGKLEKNKVIVIENGQANIGFASGNLLTGIPVDVHLPSRAVALVERPTARNNWNRVAFRCLRNTKQSVTINIQWNLLR